MPPRPTTQGKTYKAASLALLDVRPITLILRIYINIAAVKVFAQSAKEEAITQPVEGPSPPAPSGISTAAHTPELSIGRMEELIYNSHPKGDTAAVYSGGSNLWLPQQRFSYGW